MKSLMKKVLIILSMMLLALSCTKTGEVKTLNLASLMTDYEARDGETLTGIMDGNYKITIADGATVTLKNAVIYGVNDRKYKWAGITALGDATLVLEGNNIVRGFDSSFPGIFVPEGKTLTITGAGKLDVSSNGYAPGIGSEDEYGKNCGNIVVQGGTIRATGGKYSAGIGTGEGMSCGDITISGGMVTAVGGPSAAGIGCGYYARCGDISISGGSVTSLGGEFAAGIGGGSGSDIDEDVDTETPSVCGNITISGGTVMASGNSILSAAGIGSGEGNATCGDILISGGTVTAEGECDAAGIGTGARGSVGSITITNDVTQVTVKKRMERTPHSIGGGADYTRIGTVTIGGKVGPVSESPFVYKP